MKYYYMDKYKYVAIPGNSQHCNIHLYRCVFMIDMNQAPPSLSSDLQEKILQIICSNKDVTYKTLMEKTKRDRITVLQSVVALS